MGPLSPESMLFLLSSMCKVLYAALKIDRLLWLMVQLDGSTWMKLKLYDFPTCPGQKEVFHACHVSHCPCHAAVVGVTVGVGGLPVGAGLITVIGLEVNVEVG